MTHALHLVFVYSCYYQNNTLTVKFMTPYYSKDLWKLMHSFRIFFSTIDQPGEDLINRRSSLWIV